MKTVSKSSPKGLLVDLHGGEVEVRVRHDRHDLEAPAGPVEGGQEDPNEAHVQKHAAEEQHHLVFIALHHFVNQCS